MTPSLENESFWRVSQLVNKPGRRGILGISRSALYRELSAGRFPKPCRPLPGIVAWSESSVRGWLQSHMAE